MAAVTHTPKQITILGNSLASNGGSLSDFIANDTVHDIKFQFTLTGVYSNFIQILGNQVVDLKAFNNGGGSTYTAGTISYNPSVPETSFSLTGNNINLQYSSGYIQMKSANGLTYTLDCVVRRYN